VTLAIRVIPCLDVKAGKVVKGVKFQDLQELGDPVAYAKHYYEQGADELTFLDISASAEERSTTLDLVSKIADTIFIPLTVGGGVRTLTDVQNLLNAGADKVSVGSAAVHNSDLLREIANLYGDQVLVVSLDIKSGQTSSGYELTTHGGTRATEVDAFEWLEAHGSIGIGELLLNSMDSDGTKSGFDTKLISAVREVAHLPLIASGGAGIVDDFALAAKAGASAVLAASVFHNNEVSIEAVKKTLRDEGFEVRL
jgi:cyclase